MAVTHDLSLLVDSVSHHFGHQRQNDDRQCWAVCQWLILLADNVSCHFDVMLSAVSVTPRVRYANIVGRQPADGEEH